MTQPTARRRRRVGPSGAPRTNHDQGHQARKEATMASNDTTTSDAAEAPEADAAASRWTTRPLVATKANGRTKDPLKLAMASEGATRGAHLRAYLEAGGTTKAAAAALGVSTSRIAALVNGPTIKARYALRVNPEAVFRGMSAEELDMLRQLLDDMGAGEAA